MTYTYHIKDPSSPLGRRGWREITHSEFVELLHSQVLGVRATLRYMENTGREIEGKDGIVFRIDDGRP